MLIAFELARAAQSNHVVFKAALVSRHVDVIQACVLQVMNLPLMVRITPAHSAPVHSFAAYLWYAVRGKRYSIDLARTAHTLLVWLCLANKNATPPLLICSP